MCSSSCSPLHRSAVAHCAACSLPRQPSSVRSKRTASIQRFANQRPFKALYNMAQHSPIHAHIHPPTAESTARAHSQLVGSGQGEVPCSGTPRHRGSNQQPSGHQPTRSASRSHMAPFQRESFQRAIHPQRRPPCLSAGTPLDVPGRGVW